VKARPVRNMAATSTCLTTQVHLSAELLLRTLLVPAQLLHKEGELSRIFRLYTLP
jgi:hypothetical protein